MAGIIEFPQMVQDALRDFGDLFPNAPQRRHFAEYLTGLFVAACKTVSGINREFAQTTDPSCLNRFLTDADWDVAALSRDVEQRKGAASKKAKRKPGYSPRGAGRTPGHAPSLPSGSRQGAVLS